MSCRLGTGRLDRASVRRFKSLPPGYVVIKGHRFPWAIHHFQTRNLPGGWGEVLIAADRAYTDGKVKDPDPIKITVGPEELARIRAQLRERKRLRNGSSTKVR